MKLIKPSYKILDEINGQFILEKLERIGRTAYKSEDKIDTGTAEKFVRMILKRGHESVIEHHSISVRFIANRGFTHELVRHRLAAYTQESTRYCNYGGGVTFIIPPWIKNAPEECSFEWLSDNLAKEFEADWWYRSLLEAEAAYQGLLEDGRQPQQARGVLPIDLKTEIVMTANLREWHHVFKLRCSKAAHPQMQELMIPLRDELISKIPVIFDDLVEEKKQTALI